MIAENLANMFSATSLDALNPRDPAIVKMLGLGRESFSGVAVDERKVLGLPAMFRGCNILGNAVAKVRPIIYRRTDDGKERATEHSSWKFVTRRANPLLSAAEFRKTLQFHSLTWGNGIGFIDRSDSGEISGLFPLLPDRTGMTIVRQGRKIHADDDVEPGDDIFYLTRIGNKVEVLRPQDVIHVHGLSYTGTWGLPVVEILRESFGSGMATREFGARFFGQGATSSIVVFMPPGLREDQQDDFQKAIKDGYTGIGRAHKVMALEHGADVKQLTFPPEHAQFLGTLEFNNRELALAIGIQSHKLGDQSRKSYNSLEQSNQEHLDDDIDPLLQMWEDELGEKCLTEREKAENTHYIEFNRKELVRTNLEAQTDRERFEREWGLVTANELRRRNNENPIGPVGDSYLVPQNMHVLDEDGMPLVLGLEPAPNGQSGEIGELSMNRCERFVDHALAVAKSKARDDGGFLQFLEDLPGWDKQPQCSAYLLEAATTYIIERLSEFTEQPYKSADLLANIIGAAPSIREDALRNVKQELERK